MDLFDDFEDDEDDEDDENDDEDDENDDNGGVDDDDSTLPYGWYATAASDGAIYYYNDDGEVTWDRP
jgi:hypothetical protein